MRITYYDVVNTIGESNEDFAIWNPEDGDRYVEHLVGHYSTFKKAEEAAKEFIKKSGKDYHRISTTKWSLWDDVRGVNNYDDEYYSHTEWDDIDIYGKVLDLDLN